MTHGSLFSGIGGFDLAAEWMGWENKFHCEWNEFGQKILKHYWPQAETYGDITKTDFTIWRGRIDILTGGFPCQPYSTAGKRKGKEDERHLWPEMLRAIREISPSWVVGENVRGLTNWNDGMVFDEVQADLEALGYEVTPFLLPACAVNAPHRRDRIWFVAYSDKRTTGSYGSSEQLDRCWSGNNDEPESRGKQAKQHIGYGNVYENDSNTELTGLQRSESDNEQPKHIQLKRHGKAQNAANSNGFGLRGESDRIGKSGQFDENSKGTNWENFPTQSPVCGGNDGISSELDGITFPKWRNESIKAYGNAIVPQVAFQIFKAIEAYETLYGYL